MSLKIRNKNKKLNMYNRLGETQKQGDLN